MNLCEESPAVERPSDDTIIDKLLELPQREVFSLLEMTIGSREPTFDRELTRRVEFVRRGGKRRSPRVGNLSTCWIHFSAYLAVARRILCASDNKKLISRYLTAANVTQVASLLPARFGLGPETDLPPHFLFGFAVLVLHMGINDFCREAPPNHVTRSDRSKSSTVRKSATKRRTDARSKLVAEQQASPLPDNAQDKRK